MSEKKSVIIIGAGPAGLTAAYELTKKGNKVTVIESTANEVNAVLLPAAVPPNPPIETACVVLAEPLTALYKFPNDKFVLGISCVLFSVINI